MVVNYQHWDRRQQTSDSKRACPVGRKACSSRRHGLWLRLAVTTEQTAKQVTWPMTCAALPTAAHIPQTSTAINTDSNSNHVHPNIPKLHHQVFEEETAKFTGLWARRITEYETNFARAVEELRGAHEEQRLHYTGELMSKRPQRPKPSRVRCVVGL